MTETDDIYQEEFPDPPDPTKAESTEKAVFVGQQSHGDTVIIGDDSDNSGEWITTSDMVPLNVEEYR